MERTLKKTQAEVNVHAQEAVNEGVSQAGIGVILTLAGMIGAWGVACLIGGLAASDGIGDFARSWFTAVTGI
jgi:alkylhydroperoxidase/carboxymuconolactone decarboxylase family protein YurZ